MNRLFNFTDEVKCIHCKYDEDDSTYYCTRKEMTIEAIEQFDKCNVFELVYSQETINAIKALEKNLYYIPSDVHNVFKSIDSEDKDTINKAINAVNSIVDYYVDWIKHIKWEYL